MSSALLSWGISRSPPGGLAPLGGRRSSPSLSPKAQAGIGSDHFLTASGETAILKLLKPLKRETYDVYLRLLDQPGKSHLTTLRATVCECEGEVDECPEGQMAIVGAPIILAVLGAVLALLSEYAQGCPWGGWVSPPRW